MNTFKDVFAQVIEALDVDLVGPNTGQIPHARQAEDVLPTTRSKGLPRRLARALGAQGALLLSMFAAACDASPTESSGSTTTTTTTTIDGRDACEAVWSKTCASWEECAPVTFHQSFPDQATCLSLMTDYCANTVYRPGAFSPAQEMACADALAFTCSSFLRWAYEGIPPAKECAPAGTVAEGGECNFDGQCESGDCHYQDYGDFCGTCVPMGVEGGLCDTGRCEPGNACISNGSFNYCVPYLDVGQSCAAVDAICHIDLACIGGVCGPRKSVGADCDSSSKCALGSYCDATSAKCAAFAVNALDQPCANLEDNTFAVCEYGAKCKITNFDTLGGTCVPALQEGNLCKIGTYTDGVRLFGDPCIHPTACLNGMCQDLENLQCL